MGLAASLVAAAPSRDRPALTALTWIAPGHERATLLEQPATCLDPAAPGDEVRIGQALFNAPSLLGGQASRASISCASCHSNGRRNPGFFLAGISGEPGTADVSSSFFSLTRADGRFDPKPIPDLALPGKVSRDPTSHALENFLRGLIVEEFSGGEPSAGQLHALASYVRAVRACPSPTELRTLASDLALLRTGIVGGELLLDRGDTKGAQILIKTARFRLGLIDERMIGPKAKGIHSALLDASRQLALVPLQRGQLADWLARFERTVAPQLARNERPSLYDPTTLDRWLAARR